MPALHKLQSFYKQNHSVETAVTIVYKNFIFYKSRGRDTILVLLDFSADFDTVNQDILLNDLIALGIDGNVLDWFRTYPKNRKFRVCVNDTMFYVCLMETGVPQGSLLSLILFLSSTNEFHCVLESLGDIYHCYADDTQSYYTFKGTTEAENKLSVIFNKVDQ